MAGIVFAPLSDSDLERLAAWYLAHQLAEENTAADDLLVAKLNGYSESISCGVKGTCPAGGCKDARCSVPRTNDLRSAAWGVR